MTGYELVYDDAGLLTEIRVEGEPTIRIDRSDMPLTRMFWAGFWAGGTGRPPKRAEAPLWLG